jgi:hypothetical protein
MSLISSLHRVRFRHWTAFAIDIAAPSPEDAIACAKSVYREHGADMMREIDWGDDHWEAESILPGEDILPSLRRTLDALNAAPLFQVGDTDSYAIASDLVRLIRRIDGGAP